MGEGGDEQDHDAKPATPSDCPTELNKNYKRGDTKLELLNQNCYQVGDEVRIGTEIQMITAIDTETTFGSGIKRNWRKGTPVSIWVKGGGKKDGGKDGKEDQSDMEKAQKEADDAAVDDAVAKSKADDAAKGILSKDGKDDGKDGDDDEKDGGKDDDGDEDGKDGDDDG